MTFITDSGRDGYAGILEHHLKEVADEVRTIDLIDLVSFIQLESFPAIEDLLQSSTELFFREGTLTFAWMADVELKWGDLPTVKLAMEFRHDFVAVFFNFWIGAFDQAVRIEGILFDDAVDGTGQGVTFLTEALARARLPQRSVPR